MGGMFPSTQDLLLVAPLPQTATVDLMTGVTTYANATIDGVGFYVYKPDGTLHVGPVAGALKGTSGQYTVALADYILGAWTFGAIFLNGGFPVAEVPQVRDYAQWGGFADLLATAATNINDNINGNVGRIQQAVMGNTTWDHTTGTVGLFGGESFVLADEAGTPVSDQSLAVRRINSTV